MKHIGKKMLALMLAMVTTFSLTGCGAQFDASGYTQAVLDAATRAEFDKYIELTESTQEDAQAEYDEVLDSFVSEFEGLSISDELLANYRQLFVDLLAKTKYSVGEAEKDGDVFLVPLTIEPLKIYEGFDAEVEETFALECSVEFDLIIDIVRNDPTNKYSHDQTGYRHQDTFSDSVPN